MPRFRVWLGLSSAIALSASLLVASTSTTAEATSSPGSRFVSVTPFRLVDTNAGTGGSTTPLGAAAQRTYTVTGTGGVPATGVTSVVLDLTATSATEVSSFRVWQAGATMPSGTSVLRFGPGNVGRSNTAVVPLNSNGQFSVWNNAGSTNFNVDVQGYFTTAAGSGDSFNTVDIKRVAGNESSYGKPLEPGLNYDIPVTGGDIPASATAVFANVKVYAPTDPSVTSGGGLQVGPGGTAISTQPQAVNFGKSGYVDSGMSIRLSSSGAIRVRTLSSSPDVFIYVDVQGYFTPGDGGGFTPLAQPVLYDTSNSTEIPAGGSRTVTLAGTAGLPSSDDLASVMTNIFVSGWNSAGRLYAYNGDEPLTDATPSNISFHAGMDSNVGVSTTSVLEVSAAGTVVLKNDSAGPLRVRLAGQGWFGMPTIAGGAAAPTAPTSGTISLTGSLKDNGAPVSSGDVLVELWPDADYLEALPEEQTVPLWKIGDLTTNASGQFSTSFSTSNIPDQFKTATGQVDVNLYATNGTVTTTHQLSAAPAAAGTAPASFIQSSTSPAQPQVALDLGTGVTTDIADEEYDDESGEPVTEQVGYAAGRATPLLLPQLAKIPELLRTAGAPLPTGAFEEPSEIAARRDQTLSSQHAEALALISNQTGSTAPSSQKTEPAAGTALQASFSRTPLMQGDDGICGAKKKHAKTNIREKFGSIYNWSGAKVDWSQTAASKHKLGIAFSSGGNFSAKGSNSIVKGSGFLVELEDLVNLTYSNRVKYRFYADPCTGHKWWRVEKFENFFTDATASTKQTWNKSCVTYKKGKVVMDSTKAYAKEGGVSLVGVMNLDASSGYDSGTKYTMRIKKKTTVCANKDGGLVSARAIIGRKAS